ncbi:MAG: galactose mutarotase, partial [Chloroflexota bacterium]|nr:galactose mutarotase [Chloroflexota bacterium]
MPDPSPENRADQLIAAPAGCVLLLIAEELQLTPATLAKPEVGLFAIAEAIGQISPWHAHGNARIVREALRHGSRLRNRALDLVSHSGIAWWWASLDRDNQLWLRFSEDEGAWPTSQTAIRPTAPPNRFEVYVHAPRPQLATGNAVDGLSAELAVVLAGASDRAMDYPIRRRQATIRPDARVLEIDSAQDWHDLVRRYPADGTQGAQPDPQMRNVPWGQSDGMMVPDWSAVARDWDGVHVTSWALLTATQVRVSSDIGWTEPWSWEGDHAIWLAWPFETVENLPPVEDGAFEAPYYLVKALDFSDPEGQIFTRHPPGGWPLERGVTSEPFGEVDGQLVDRYTLTNDTGMSVSILTYGGIIQSLNVSDRHGDLGNVVLGFDNLDDYVSKSPYFGAIVGRYANRIAEGRFALDGTTYQLPVNNGPNSLHGGANGFDRRLWTASIESERDDSPMLRLSRTSPDGEEGYPGSVDVTVTYSLMNGNALRISYEAISDAPTVLNLSNHTYFNLAGEGNGTILRHALLLRASHYTPVNEFLIPTGEIAPVIGTPF